MRRDLEIVVAADENWGIGYKGTQTLVVSEDRRHFREITGRGVVIVGRKTFLDFPGGRPLRDRRNIVLTRNVSFAVEGAKTAHSVEEALKLCENDEKVFVIGGESVYKAFFPYCGKAHITRIFATADNDAFFPNLESLSDWRLADPGKIREHGGLRYAFQTWVRA